jgi:hypothetical protein
MPGRKVFVANDILTAADVNEFLANQAVMVFADATARTTAIPSPLEGMVTYLTDSDGLFTWSGSAWVPAINTASLVDGNVTTAKLGAGTILQVVHVTDTTNRSGSGSGVFNDSGVSITVTPQRANSLIMIWALGYFATDPGGIVQITDTSNVGIAGAQFFQFNSRSNLSIVGYDLPNSTAAKTYKVRLGRNSGSNAAVWQNATTTGQIYGIEVAR